jgi:SAM-dependent methyltransferase
MVATDRKEHWEQVYSTKGETGVSWYQREPRLSLELIRTVAPAAGGRIIDIGGGTSGLVDRLLDLSFEKIAVLDISETALGKARARLGARAGRVEWIAADITEAPDVGTFEVWHDRAVFHFLTDAADRCKYVELARRTVPKVGLLHRRDVRRRGTAEVQRSRCLPLQPRFVERSNRPRLHACARSQGDTHNALGVVATVLLRRVQAAGRLTPSRVLR